MPVRPPLPARSSVLPPFRRLALPALVVLALSGCATQEFVTREIGQSNERITGIEAWFKSVNQGLDSQANRLRDLEARLERAENAQAGLTGRVDETRADLAGTGLRLVRLSGEVAGLKQRVDSVSSEAGRAHDRLESQDARLASVGRRLEGTVAGLSAAEVRIGALERQGLVSSPASMPASSQATPEPASPAWSPAPAKLEVEAPTAPVASAAVVLAPATVAPAAEPAAPVAAATNLPGETVPTQPALVPAAATQAVPAPAAATETTAAPAPAPQVVAAQAAANSDQADELARLNAQVAELKARLARQSEALETAFQAAKQQLGGLEAQAARIGAQTEANAQAIGRIDGRVGVINAELDNARQRVEAGEKNLAESGVRLTMVQDLLMNQGERLARNEAEAGKLSSTAQEALQRALQAGRLAEGKLVFEATLTDEVANFGFEQAELNAAARKQLTEFADRLKAENKGAFIEIQGHTDSVGPAEANLRLSRARAQSVRDFLHQEARIPLHLLAVVAYGETRPVANNGTQAGRAKNRRVVLVVLR